MSKTAIYKGIIKSSAIYSIAVFAPTLASLVLLPVYTRCLSPADYAVLDLLDLTRNLFSMLVGGRFAEALFYFYANAPDPGERKRIVGTAMMGAFLVGAFGAALGCTGSYWLGLLVFQTPRWTSYFHLSFITLGLTIPLEMGFAWLRARDQAVSYVMASLTRLGVGIAVTATLLVVFHKGVEGVLWGNLITTVLIAILVGAPCLLKNSLSFEPAVFKNLVRFALPLGLSGLAVFAIHYGDRFFLQRYVPLAEVGIYSIAYKMGMLVSLAQTAFGQYWGGQLYFVIGGEEGLYRFKRINTYLMLVLSYGCVLVTVFAPAAIRTFTPPQFWACIPFVPWIAAAYIVRAEADYFRAAFFLEKRPGLDARMNWIAAIFCLGAYFALIPAFRVRGAIAATSLTFVLLACVCWWRARKLRPYTLERARLIKIFGVTALVCAAGNLGHPGALWASWLIAALWALAFPVILCATGFLEESERKILWSTVDRLRQGWASRAMRTSANS
jgi:O-antigen/teichoic acid export membrane protein